LNTQNAAVVKTLINHNSIKGNNQQQPQKKKTRTQP